MSWWILKRDKKTGKKSWTSIYVDPMMIIIVVGLLAALVSPKLLHRSSETLTEKIKKPPLDKHEQSIADLNEILKDNNIALSVPPTTNIDLAKSFAGLARNVNDTYRNKVLNYLDSREASSLIQEPTSKPGVLRWNIYDVIFLENNLIFAQYEDGHMYGGRFIGKTYYSSETSDIKMQILWNN